jgi:hypothetical protein
MFVFGIIIILIILFRNIDSSFINFSDRIKTLKITSSPLMINIAYNLLYCFSWCQIQLCKIKTNIRTELTNIDLCFKNYLKDKGWITDIVINEMIIIDNNGNEICNLRIENKVIVENDCANIDYAGILLLDEDINTNCVNHVFYEKIPKNIDYKVSKLKFMSIELDYNNNNYLIDLKNNDNNYYIVNNYLNEFFFKYYIKNILNLSIDQNNFNYNVTIIDNDVNIIYLLPYQSIKINEDNYEIFPIENIESNDESNIETNDTSDDKISENNIHVDNLPIRINSDDKLIENNVFVDKISENSDSDDKSRNNSIIYDSDEYVKLETA